MTASTISSLNFSEELENFQVEEESAQQYFLGYLSLQWIPGSNERVLDRLNDHPTFWLTVRYALFSNAFLALGRIFDQDNRSVHNIDRLLRAVSQNLESFSKNGLYARRISEGMDPVAAKNYVSKKYDLTVEDVRALRRQVTHWRRIYEARYRDIRHLVFAHRGIKRIDIDELMGKAKIDEALNLLEFLDAFYVALRELYLNGTRPVISPTALKFPPDRKTGGSETSGERVYRQAMDLMFEALQDVR
jgi:hypothetical protein